MCWLGLGCAAGGDVCVVAEGVPRGGRGCRDGSVCARVRGVRHSTLNHRCTPSSTNKSHRLRYPFVSGYAAHLSRERWFFSVTCVRKCFGAMCWIFFPLLLSHFLISELAEFTLHKLIFYVSYFTMLWQVAASSGVC